MIHSYEQSIPTPTELRARYEKGEENTRTPEELLDLLETKG